MIMVPTSMTALMRISRYLTRTPTAFLEKTQRKMSLKVDYLIKMRKMHTQITKMMSINQLTMTLIPQRMQVMQRKIIKIKTLSQTR